MVTLSGIIVRILRKYGYEPVERDGIIEGELPGRRINVGFYDGGAAGDTVAKLMRMDGARVVACLADMDAGERRALESKGIVVWDRHSLEEEIGTAIVTHLEANRGGLFEMLAVREMKAEPKETPLPVLVESDDGVERVLRPAVSFENVKEISAKTIGGYKYDLELVPYYFFEYFCIVKVSGIESPDKRTGTIGVNALTGDAQPWARFGEVVSDIGQPHARLEPKVEPREAEGAAMRKVVQMHTEEVERVVEKGHARIYDKMLVRPEEGDVTLDFKGLVYAPMWCVEGLNGVMVLNAATGKVVSEEYYLTSGKKE